MSPRIQAWLDLLRRYREVFGAAWSTRGEGEGPDRTAAEAEYLPAVMSIQETPPHPAAGWLGRLIIGFFVLLLLWSMIGKADIVVSAPGQTLPDGRTKVIQAERDGVVTEVLVDNGTRVGEGERLIVLDATVSEAQHRQTRSEWMDWKVKKVSSEWLASLADGAGEFGKLSDEEELSGLPGELLFESQLAAESVLSAHRSALSELDGRLGIERNSVVYLRRDLGLLVKLIEEEKRLWGDRIANLSQELETLEEVLPLERIRHDSSKRLYEAAAVTKRAYEDRLEVLLRLEGEMELLRGRLTEERSRQSHREVELNRERAKLEGDVVEAEHRVEHLERQREAFVAEFRRMMLERREEARGMAERHGEELVKLERLRRGHDVLSPIAGVVEQLQVHTVGGFVEAGQALLVVVPEDGVLEVEALLENKDIGFVEVGHRAEVKLDAFPYTKYGLLEGEVVDLSDDAIEDEQRGLVYRVRVRLLESSVDVGDGKKVPLISGMSATVEIKTGERRVIEFFLSPLLEHKSESLNER